MSGGNSIEVRQMRGLRGAFWESETALFGPSNIANRAFCYWKCPWRRGSAGWMNPLDDASSARAFVEGVFEIIDAQGDVMA